MTRKEERARLEQLERLLKRLEDLDIPIIVEGDRDIMALQRLGISGPIIKINQGVSLTTFCEQVARKYRHVILLTDWDRKGHELLGKLKRNFQAHAVKVDTETRLELFRLCKSDCREVEAIDYLVERLMAEERTKEGKASIRKARVPDWR